MRQIKLEDKNTYLEKYLATATLSDIKAMITEAVREATLSAVAEEEEKRRHVYGLAGLANLLGCSVSTAERIKASGVIDEAITQHKGIIIVDAEMALDLLRTSGKHHSLLNRNTNNKKAK